MYCASFACARILDVDRNSSLETYQSFVYCFPDDLNENKAIQLSFKRECAEECGYNVVMSVQTAQIVAVVSQVGLAPDSARVSRLAKIYSSRRR